MPLRAALPILLCCALLLGKGARADTTGLSVEDLHKRHAYEGALLHLPVDRVLLGALPVWDDKTHALRLRVRSESFDDQRPIMILHLWATWCGPCKEEFGAWKALEERLVKRFAYEVQIVHIALQPDITPMAGFVKQQGRHLPSSPMFFDADERLARLLQKTLGTHTLPALPITLWLGPGRTVRQALVGAISNRGEEVLESTERLIRSIQHLRNEAQQTPTKQVDDDVFTRDAPCRCPCVCN